MSENSTTLALLRTIAEANETSIDAFLIPGRRGRPDVQPRQQGPYRHAALLPRLFRAYFALPGGESRLRALRMMEAMAARAKGVSGRRPVVKLPRDALRDGPAGRSDQRNGHGPASFERHSVEDSSSEAPMSSLIRILLAIFIPPIAVLVTTGFGLQFLLNIVLWILGWLPGTVHALWLMNRERPLL